VIGEPGAVEEASAGFLMEASEEWRFWSVIEKCAFELRG
jgi:hypothetical protein